MGLPITDNVGYELEDWLCAEEEIREKKIRTAAA
jgi:hypothetical protein